MSRNKMKPRDYAMAQCVMAVYCADELVERYYTSTLQPPDRRLRECLEALFDSHPIFNGRFVIQKIPLKYGFRLLAILKLRGEKHPTKDRVRGEINHAKRLCIAEWKNMRTPNRRELLSMILMLRQVSNDIT